VAGDHQGQQVNSRRRDQVVKGRGGWIGGIAMLISAFVVLGLIAGALFPTPQGPALSSFSTTPDGVAAWATLLQRDGHSVSQLRDSIATTRLTPATTLVVLASAPLSSADESGLTRFVNSGGRLVVGGAAARSYWATLTAGHAPLPSGTSSHPLGAGDVVLFDSAASLENRELASGDHAQLALQLAGSSNRPVAFLESIHGFGPATGLAAFPQRWWVAIVLLAIAGGIFLLARAQRLGGSDPLPAIASSARGAYIDAMTVTLSRTEQRGELAKLASDLNTKQPGSRLL